MKLSKKTSKIFKLCIVVCICGSVLYGIYLLNMVHNVHLYQGIPLNKTLIYKNGDFDIQVHPHNILPVFIHKRLTPQNLSTSVIAENLIMQNRSNDDIELNKNQSIINSELALPSKYAEFATELSQLREVTIPLCYEVHAFYYPWYGTPDHDGQYLHWNHPYIPHWNKKEAQKWPNYTHRPPDDVGSNFYPLLGAYSSRDNEVIDLHMQMMRYAGIGVVVVSWYPAGDADMSESEGPDTLMPSILDAAHKYMLKVAVHVEPYKGRNHVTMRENLRYIMAKYGQHPAFYRTSLGNKKNLPLIYLYDSYLVDSSDWNTIFSSKSNETVRGTDLDAIFIGLLVEMKHKDHIVDSGFDGFYTYFATNQFTYGSTWKEWPHLAQFSNSKGLLFIPSVGPGYIDTEVRPWNAGNTRKRLDGQYYNEAFSSALSVKPSVISITSFNEWHEGTQIEPAVRKKTSKRTYLDYGSKGPNFYLDLTRTWVEKMSQK